MATRFAIGLFLAAFIGTQPSIALVHYDAISDDGFFSFALDKVGKSLSDAKIKKYKDTYYQLRDARRIGPIGTCTLYGVDFSCSQRTLRGLLISADVSDNIPSPATPSPPSSGEVVLEGLLPAPIPYLSFNEKQLTNGLPKYDREIEPSSGDSPYAFRLISGQPRPTSFDERVARTALNSFMWRGIEDFTSFAPADAIFHGTEVMSLLKSSVDYDYTQSKCSGVCPHVVRRTRSGREQYLFCYYHHVRTVYSSSFLCTTVAFEDGGTSWLRTRQLFDVNGGRGAGPEESFRCDSGLDEEAAAKKTAEELRSSGYRVIEGKTTEYKSHKVIASALGRLSDIALNRYEVTNIFIDFFGGQGNKPPGQTMLLYTIPTYRLSATRVETILEGKALSPKSFDAGITPDNKIIRSFEADLRKHLEKALDGGKCESKAKAI